MDGKSLDILSDKLNKLKELIPDTFTEDKIDWEKLKLSLGDDLNLSEERYHLNWAGKSEVFRVLQQRTAATLIPAKEESVNFDETDNVFIEGENLEVLKVLQKSYFGKIKMIYIDPPYNTGNDSFIYPDRFSETKDEYLKRIGEKDEEGYLLKEGMFRKNSKDGGHYHSNWLSMMYPRLYLARNLLRDDGVIFVSIDDNEVHNLRMIMNEIFGEENFISQFIWKSRMNKDNRNVTRTSIDHEYVLCYGRKLRGSERKLEQYQNPDNDPRGAWTSGNMVGLLPVDQRPNCHYNLISPKTKINYGKPKMGWRYDKNTMKKLIEENKIIWPAKSTGRPRRKLFLSDLKEEYTGYSSIIGFDYYTKDGTSEIEQLFGFRVMEFPKSSELIKELLVQGLGEDDLVLDFFAGSGTTAQAVMELNIEDGGNRKFILVQLPEKTDEKSEAFKAEYKTIADICKERIRRVIKKLEQNSKVKSQKKGQEELKLEHSDDTNNDLNVDLGFKVFKLTNSNFKIWRSDIVETEEDLKKMVDMFDTQVKDGSKEENMLYELMLKSGYTLMDKVEKKNGYFSISEGELVIVLKKVKQKQIDRILKLKPKNCIMLDNLFAGNDKLKTNTALQMKDAGVEFRTI